MIVGSSQTKYGALYVIPADNLASNLLGGFKEGSTAHRGCHHCLITSDQVPNLFLESQLVLRSLADHKQKCQGMEDAREFAELSKQYEINHRSLLVDKLICVVVL